MGEVEEPDGLVVEAVSQPVFFSFLDSTLIRCDVGNCPISMN